MTLNEFIKANTLPLPNDLTKSSVFICDVFTFKSHALLEVMFKSHKIRTWYCQDTGNMFASLTPRNYGVLVRDTPVESLLIP